MRANKLSEFLKENNAYEDFIESCLSDKNSLQYIKDCALSNIGISNGFTWDATPQGYSYWEDLYNEIYKYDIIYDMDDALYREYEKRLLLKKESENKFEKSLEIMENILQNTSKEEIDKTIQEENMKQKDIKQEPQTIILDGVEYYLVPKKESPLLTLDDLRDIGLSDEDLLNNGFSEEDLKKNSNEEFLRRKFKTDEYICVMRLAKTDDWVINTNPSFYQNNEGTIEYKLIKKEHKEILEAYLENNALEIEYRWLEESWKLLENFIERYDEDMQLKVIKKDFKPFTLNIEVNTLDEAKSLWNIFNLSYDAINEAVQSNFSKHYFVKYKNSLDCYYYWNQLNDVLEDLGERPISRKFKD